MWLWNRLANKVPGLGRDPRLARQLRRRLHLYGPAAHLAHGRRIAKPTDAWAAKHPASPFSAARRQFPRARTRRSSSACRTRTPIRTMLARFTAPEFTSLCPVTGQPDFAHLVIDYVPREWLVESKSLKLYLASFRNHGAFHEDCTVAIGKRLVALLDAALFLASAATGTRAAASRSTFSGRRASCPRTSGCPIRASRPIAAAADESAGSRTRPFPAQCRTLARSCNDQRKKDPAARPGPSFIILLNRLDRVSRLQRLPNSSTAGSN